MTARRDHERAVADQAAREALLAEAGYKDGFEVDFACSNNAIIQDEELCQAITSMCSRIGVKAKLRTLLLPRDEDDDRS